ncbi:MAG TPA: class IV adenylate cyclase [Thermoanaerobaculia bacterium]|nr:class IV adenylate cyclase [Thermoanaerobaculia bacterium]
MQAPREIEAKFRVADRPALESRLTSLGARPGSREDETNVLYDEPGGRLRAEGCALRLRTVNDRGLLTFKGPPKISKGVKSRLEWESEVGSPRAVAAILESLGYRPSFRYDKRRTTWDFADPSRPVVVVDEIPLGLFAEIEGPDAAVRRLAGELGVAEADFIAESYVGLWLAAREKDPSLPKDMVFS